MQQAGDVLSNAVSRGASSEQDTKRQKCHDQARIKRSKVSHARHAVPLPCVLSIRSASGEGVPQQPIGSLHTLLSSVEAGKGRSKPLFMVADDVKPSAGSKSVCDKEDQPKVSSVACECGNVRQACSADGCQQQCCCNCALDNNKQQDNDFTFCDSQACCGKPMYCGDHIHLLDMCCQCETVICHNGEIQECPCCQETLWEGCSSSAEHELECHADQWDDEL